MRKDEKKKKKKKNGRICISGRNYSTRTNAPVIQPSFDYGLDAKPAFQCSVNMFREAYSSGDNRHRVTRNSATHHAPLPRERARDEMTKTENREPCGRLLYLPSIRLYWARAHALIHIRAYTRA